MELVERYLQAIGKYLPADSRNDILAELRTELLDQMDARAEEWGRPLDEADVAALLKVHGRPEVVAPRYLPQRWLIGPTIFPFYWFTLRRGLPLVAGIALIANVADVVFSSHPSDVAARIVPAIFRVIPTLFIAWGIMTLVFVFIEYACNKSSASASLEHWDPLKLPALKPQHVKQKSFNVRVLELVVHCLWMVYVLLIPAHPFLILGPGAWALRQLGVSLAPVWRPFFVLIIAMLSVQLVTKILALRSGEQRVIKPLGFVANILGIGALSLVAFARQVIVSSSPTADLQQLASLNYALSIALRIALIAAAFGLISEIWRYLRDRMNVRRRVTV